MTEERQALVARASQCLKGVAETPEDCFELAKALLRCDEIGWARRLLDVAVERGIPDHRLRLKVAQKRALATYKDPHLGRDAALQQAFSILTGSFDLGATDDPETLGLAGAICKRQWEVDSDKLHLERALKFYRRGFEVGLERDRGYTGINAAFVLDLLAHIEETQAQEAGMTSPTAPGRRAEAQTIRRRIVDVLKPALEPLADTTPDPDAYWPIVTLAEACFGLHAFDEARLWLGKARRIDKPDWEYASTAQQLARLAELQMPAALTSEQLEHTEAWQTLLEFLAHNAQAVRSIFRGKMGLALSGGGFRASLYHIGVLAKLAELDLLRHVEVLSCVSGGSIVGAHYYLELRRLIDKEKRRDADIQRADYIRIVQNMATAFLAGVQCNPRMRILANPWSNLKMLFWPGYTRTQRIGELYEELIYARVDDGEGTGKRWLNDLLIHPVEAPEDFLPRRDNWARNAKIPELILNATTLNTGHNWQFTASWMGESPACLDPRIDSNDRYRRMYYREAPQRYKKFRLGHAVGASSCVPGLFEPLILPGLYPDTTVRLIDGGIYDNQGTAGLLEQDCNVLLVSDASGQMGTETDPGGGILKPLLRTNNTLMERVRSAQYLDLKSRQRGSLVKNLLHVHLKWGLDARTLNWIDCDEPPETPPQRETFRTPYGIRKDIQALLADIRTDLDSFSDLEAYALMTSGYRATELAAKELKGFPANAHAPARWSFLDIEPCMNEIHGESRCHLQLKTHLRASRLRFLKIWRLSKGLTFTAIALGLALVGGVLYAWRSDPDWAPLAPALTALGQHLTLDLLVTLAGIALLGYLVTALLGPRSSNIGKQLLGGRETLKRIAIGLGVGTIGWIGAQLHLRLFDRMFLRKGQWRS